MLTEFLSANFQFLDMKFSIYLNRCVFVMHSHWLSIMQLGSVFSLSAILSLVCGFHMGEAYSSCGYTSLL